MPFTRPTRQQIIERIRSDIDTAVPGADSRLRRSVLDVLARSLGGAVHLLYGFLDFLARQIFVDTAEAEYLARHGAIWGIVRLVASFFTGVARFTGTNGSAIPLGTQVRRSDGKLYETTAAGVIAAGIADVPVEALESGAASNCLAGQTLSLTAPLTGVDTDAAVQAAGLADGVDAEDDESYRHRILLRIQQPPTGGSIADYEQWILQVAGVTRVWVLPLVRGLGTVDAYFVRDDDTPSIIPDAGEVAAVQAYVDARRPVTADFLAVAPTAFPVNFDVQLAPDTPEVRAAVQAELEALVKRASEPAGTLLISQVNEAVSIAAGESDHVMVAPVADVVSPAGNLAVPGTFNFGPIP